MGSMTREGVWMGSMTREGIVIESMTREDIVMGLMTREDIEQFYIDHSHGEWVECASKIVVGRIARFRRWIRSECGSASWFAGRGVGMSSYPNHPDFVRSVDGLTRIRTAKQVQGAWDARKASRALRTACIETGSHGKKGRL